LVDGGTHILQRHLQADRIIIRAASQATPEFFAALVDDHSQGFTPPTVNS
jgi:hypothetical protein